MKTVGVSNLLQGKRVVITGGAGLLGRQFCAAVAQHGGVVIVADLMRESADKVASSIVAEGGQATGWGLDITSTDSVVRLIDDLHAHHGGVDAVVNNAYPKNQNYGRRFENVEYADMCDSLSMHLAGYFLVAQKFADAMRFLLVASRIGSPKALFGTMTLFVQPKACWIRRIFLVPWSFFCRTTLGMWMART